MNSINFSLLDGLPMNQLVLGRLQSAFSIFNALGAVVGNKTIISGCELTGSTVADGVVFINGELLEFRGGIQQETVLIIEETTNLTFRNDNSYPVIKTRYVAFATGAGQMNWTDFKRGYPTKDIADGKADMSVFNALADAFALVFTKMITIQEGANVNVQPDWNQTVVTADSFIKNKPNTINVLYQGVFNVGNVLGQDELKTISFPTVGTNNYMVIGSMVSDSSNYNNDNDVFWMVREKTNNSFKLALREVSTDNQNLSFEYILIPLA